MLQNQRAKDAAMAARMKAAGIERRHANCPICHRVSALSGFQHHIVTCKGR